MTFSIAEGPEPARPPRRTGRLVLAGCLLQLVALLLTYGKLIFHPGQYLIIDHYDGIKSYFSLATFLRQPLSEGLMQHGHNYPFGEYIFFTDISPLVSVPLHVLVRAVPALAPYGLYLYDLFTLLGLVVSTLLLVSILRRLAVPGWLALVLSVALPWLSPQTFRLNVGHMSLSYTPAVLLPLWLLQGLYGAWRAGQPTGRWWLGLGAALVAGSWLHFYYLGIVGGWLGFFFLFWIGREALARRPWRGLAGRAALLLGSAAVLTFGVLQVLDKRRGDRPTGSGGYDWIEWKFQFGTLFRGHDFYKVRFFLERTADVPYESTAYLGGFVLYGLVVVGILALVARYQRRQGLPDPGLLPPLPGPTDGNRAFLLLLLAAAVPLALAALGETIDVDNGNYLLHNYLNPFFMGAQGNRPHYAVSGLGTLHLAFLVDGGAGLCLVRGLCLAAGPGPAPALAASPVGRAGGLGRRGCAPRHAPLRHRYAAPQPAGPPSHQ